MAAWCNQWKLRLNQAKCAAMRMSLSPITDDEPEYHLENQAIATPDSQRDLGIASSRNLSWSTHYSAICREAYNSLHLLRRTLPSSSPINLKKKLYLTLVRSHFSYCCQLWKPRLIKDITAIERVQRKATKYILNDYSTSYKNRLRQLQLFPISLWLDLLDIMFLVKCIKDKEDNMNIHEFITISTAPTRAGSSGLSLNANFTHTLRAKHFYFNRIVQLWNHVQPSTFTLSDSIETIKTKIIGFLFHHFDHSHELCNTYHLLCLCHFCH